MYRISIEFDVEVVNEDAVRRAAAEFARKQGTTVGMTDEGVATGEDAIVRQAEASAGFRAVLSMAYCDPPERFVAVPGAEFRQGVNVRATKTG